MPIVAFTARAMKGDKEECLAAGMDGYISKPVRAETLYTIVEDLCSASGAAALSAGNDVDKPAAHDKVIDMDQLSSLTGGDTALIGNLVSLFSTESESLLVQLRKAIVAGDHTSVERAAHTIKGSAASMTGFAVARIADEIESLGRTRKSHIAQPTCSRLEDTVTRRNHPRSEHAGRHGD